MKKVYAFVDGRISESCEAGLKGEGFEVIKLPPMQRLPSAIASHTDILILKIRDRLFLSRKYCEECGEALSLPRGLNIRLTESAQGEKYPSDAIFNGLILGDLFFCKRDSFSQEALEYARSLGYEVRSVRQGYPACTTLKISENAAITADAGMERALREAGVSVLKIENGSVSLPPYEYGFIGGAGGLYKDKVYFLGDIKTHKNADAIIGFIENFGKRTVSLSNEPLADLGGILFIENDI